MKIILCFALLTHHNRVAQLSSGVNVAPFTKFCTLQTADESIHSSNVDQHNKFQN